MDPIQILVVEDEVDLEFLMERKFKRRFHTGEFQFLFAKNGQEALHCLEAHPDIAVVVSDLKMPEMDGLTLLKHLNEQYPLLRTIIITAYGDMNNIRTAMNQGAYDFLQKPIDFDDLDATLDKAIRASTRHKRVEHALQMFAQQYRTLAEHVGDGIAVIQDKKVVFVNTALCEMFEDRAAHLLRMSPDTLLGQKEPQKSGTEQSSLGTPASLPAHTPPAERSWHVRHVTSAGRELWTETRQHPMVWDSRPAVLVTIRDITSRKRRDRMMQKALEDTLHDRYRFGDLVGKSPAMQEIYTCIVKAAATDEAVVICGESGTGKELIAQTIHRLSPRSGKPFVVVNCSAITETIFEREFFGHRKGAFTGADRDAPGFFEAASQGTLFLDEVGELRPALQVKLLRAIENGEYTPVGSQTANHADLRLIAATNRPLIDLVKTGAMREDFFYRIRVISITVPPLRERKEDLSLLVDHFLQQAGYAKIDLPAEVFTQLYAHNWPGNVREVQNVLAHYRSMGSLEFADIRAPGPEEPDALTLVSEAEGKSRGGRLRATVEAFEKRLLIHILEQQNWHRTKAAAMLGIPIRSLRRKMKHYQIIPPSSNKSSEP